MKLKHRRRSKSATGKLAEMSAILVACLCFGLASGEHWPNYWSPINHGDEPIPTDDRTDHAPPPMESYVAERRSSNVPVDGFIDRRQLYVNVAKQRQAIPLGPTALQDHGPIIAHHHPIPEAKPAMDEAALSSNWVPMQADPMKGDPLFEYIPPALQTVKLGEFQAESDEAEAFVPPAPLQSYSSVSGPIDAASLLLASTHLGMFANPLADDAFDRIDNEEDEKDFNDDESHPYYGAGRIKVAMDDPNSKERLPFNSQGATQYSAVNPALRRTTIMPLHGNIREASDELETTTVGDRGQQKTTAKLVYQAPPRRVKTTEKPPNSPEIPSGEESLLSFLQNWLQASGPAPETASKPAPSNAPTTVGTSKPVTTTSASTTSTTVHPETTEAEEPGTGITEPTFTSPTPKVKLEQRHRAPISISTNRPLRFPVEQKTVTKSPLTSVEELAHAVRPIVSTVPFIIVQGHSKVKMYGVNTLEEPAEKHAPGSKQQTSDKPEREDSTEKDYNDSTQVPVDPEEDEEEGDEGEEDEEDLEEPEHFVRDIAAVERPILPRPPAPRPQGHPSRRPADFRFPNQKIGQGGLRPPGPLRLGGPPRPPLRPMRPVFFTKRNPSGTPTTHSNPFEYFSQLARLTASRIKAQPPPPEEPLAPRNG